MWFVLFFGMIVVCFVLQCPIVVTVKKTNIHFVHYDEFI